MFSDDLFLYVSPLTCFDYNENGQLIAQHQWKVPSKEENARNGLPDGRQINYLYYGSGHLHQISLDDEVITDIERDQLHREIFRTQGKLASRYELDPLGRLKRQIATLNDLTEGGKGKNKIAAGYGQTAVKRSYGYDRTGNLTHSTDQRTGTTQFEYDRLGRITKAGSELFAFDPAHNILDIPTEKVKPYPTPSPVGEGRGEGKTAAPLSDDRSVIPDNRLKTYNGTTYYYDELGNLIHRELADGEVQNYFYDLHDQLVKAEIFKKDGTKETWCYTYDALGRRIGKGRLKTDGSLEDEIRFVWDGSHLLQEIHQDGRYTYIYADQDSYEPLAQVRDWTTAEGENRQQTHYFHCDQIGIPREMTDKDGNLLWFGNYTGWGRLKEETKVTDSAYQPFRLQNQYADRETGLHYNFFRYYEPDAGRFVNQDPIGLNGAVNLYLFSFNMTKWIDPLGLNPMNGATVTVIATIAGKQPISVTVSSANKVHAEIRALQQLRAQGALVGADVKIKDVTGHFPNKENKEVQVCAKCRHDIFEELIKGEANSVTIPIKGGGVIVIMKAQFEAAQKGTAKVLNDFEGSRRYKARSDKQFEELRKHQSGC